MDFAATPAQTGVMDVERVAGGPCRGGPASGERVREMGVTTGPGDGLDRFRGYLSRLARGEVSPGLRSAIDLSGVVQQTLLDALRSPPRPRTEAETAAWLRAILRNNLADEVRREGARKRDRERV